MKYTDIQQAVKNANRLLRERDSFIRMTAERLLETLRSNEYGFPDNEICLQPIDHPLNDSKAFHPVQLPTDDEDGRRGFRVRFEKNHGDYLSTVFCSAAWSFTLDGNTITAQLKSGMKPHKVPLEGSPTDDFVRGLADDTVRYIAKMISRIPSGEPEEKEIGFHKINE